MIAALREFGDWLLGRGEASITIPIFDGALKPNQILEGAEVVAEFEDASDIAADRDGLLIADGTRVIRLVPPHSNGEVAPSYGDGGVMNPRLRPLTPPSAYDADTSPEDGGGRMNSRRATPGGSSFREDRCSDCGRSSGPPR